MFKERLDQADLVGNEVLRMKQSLNICVSDNLA